MYVYSATLNFRVVGGSVTQTKRDRINDRRQCCCCIRYMSPEQYNDEPVTPASDIWALGATLFKITTGPSIEERGESNDAGVRVSRVKCSGV